MKILSKRKFKYSMLYTGVLAAILALLIMLPSIFRFHGVFIIRGDYVDQYILRVIKTQRMLLGGFPSWDWTSFFGAPYISWNNFFSFNSICLLFPEKYIPYGVTLSNMLRFSVAAMTCYAYLKRFIKNEKYLVVGGLLYAFSSYSLINLEFMQFMDAAAVFPLLLIAAEDMFTSNNYKHTLIFASFINAYISFYFYVAVTIFFAIYFLIRFFVGDDWKKTRNRNRMFFLAVIEYILGFLISGIITLPFVYQMFHTSRAISSLEEPIFKLSGIINENSLAKLWAMLTPGVSNRFNSFFGVTVWQSVGAYLPIFGVSLCIAYLLKHKAKKWANILLVLLVVISIIPLFNDAFSLYTAGYTRWWYAVVLIMTLITVKVLSDYEKYQKSITAGVYISVSITALMLVLFAAAYTVNSFYPNLAVQTFFVCGGAEADAESKMRMFGLAAIVLFNGLLFAFLKSKAIRSRIISILCISITIYGAGYIIVNNTDLFLMDHAPETKMTLNNMVDAYYFDERPINNNEGYIYRIDYPKYLNNYSISVNSPSISTFDSLRGTFSNDFAEFARFCDDGSNVRAFPSDDNNVIRSLLSVKYYYNYASYDGQIKIPDGFDFLKQVGKVSVYENKNYIPFGFAYSKYILKSQFLQGAERGNLSVMSDALVINDEDENKVKDILSKSSDFNVDIDSALKERKTFACNEFQGTSKGFTAKIPLPSEKVIFFSAPFEKRGWTAYVNGKETEIINANIGFMAIRVPRGNNKIEFIYRHPALNAGIFVSIIGLILTASYLGLMNKKKLLKDTALIK